MKTLIAFLLLLSLSCGKTSSPEGRMKLENNKLQIQIDELKSGQKTILDSLLQIKKQLELLKKESNGRN